MAVRFLPSPEDRPSAHREDRGDLAEVIEFRSRLRRPAPEADGETDAGARPGTRRAGAAGAAGSGPDADSGSGSAGIPTAERDGLRVIDAEALLGGRGAAGRTAHSGGASGTASDAASGTAADPASGTAADRAASGARSKRSKTRGAFEVIEGGAQGVAGDAPVREEPVDDGPSASERAVRLLARKAMSSGELQRALVAAGHPELDAEDAVAECERSLYLDDGDLARTLAVKLRESKGESRSRIRQKLRERHLPSEAIEAALEELDDDAEHELLRQTAADRAKRLVDLDRQTAERRLLGFLARRGWSGERATRAAREALDGAARSAGGGGSVRFR